VAGLSDSAARAVLDRVAPAFGALSVQAIDNVQTVCRGETRYGRAWASSPSPCDSGWDSYNWGAVKVKASATKDANGNWGCAPTGFPCFDEDKVTPHCFRQYANDDEGAAGVFRVLMGMKHVSAFLLAGGGTPAEMAHVMRLDGYYTAPEKDYTALLTRMRNEMLPAMGRKAGVSVAAMVTGGLSLLGIGLAGWRFSR